MEQIKVAQKKGFKIKKESDGSFLLHYSFDISRLSQQLQISDK